MSRSVLDPEFKYSPSKNIYWDKLLNPPVEMERLARTDHQTEEHRGHWREQFLCANSTSSSQNSPENSSEPAILHVEIGCNAGHVSIEWAKQNPKSLYIGIDWKFKQIYRLDEKALKFQVKNLIAFRANADRLPYMFKEGEIDFLYLFFPDPWPKKAHLKNRTANTAWLKSVAPLLSKRGHFHIKTDHAAYFEFILGNLSELTDTYEILEMTKDLHAGNEQARELKIPQVTLFERLFIKDGLPIHSVKIRAK